MQVVFENYRDLFSDGGRVSGAPLAMTALESAGFTCWIVGGAVRDALLGNHDDGDMDLSTSATPEQMISVFEGWKVLPTGLKHGTVTVVTGNVHVEITTYRVDGGYGDHRRPDGVTFTDSICDDLARRDFTINAMAWHPERGLLDPYGGLEDIRSGVIRAVGDPCVRFSEDALRMLRAVRFAAKLGFTIHGDTWEAIRKHASSISMVAHERCAAELMAVLCSPRPEAIRLLHDAGLLCYLLPEIDMLFDPVSGAQRNPHHVYTIGEHTMLAVANVPPSPVLRLSALLHDVGKPSCRKPHPRDGRDTFYGHPEVSERMARSILRRLCIPKEQRDRILPLIRWHDTVPNADAYELRRFLWKTCGVHELSAQRGAEFFKDWMVLKRADILGQNPKTHAEKLELLEQLRVLFRQIIDTGQPYTRCQLAITGDDVTTLGIKGPDVGKALDVCLRAVLRNPSLNERSLLLDMAKRLKKGG